MKTRKLSIKVRILLCVCAGLVLLSAVCFGIFIHLSRMLPSQQEAERWQGESDTEYRQITCFLPADEQITLSSVAAFRNAAMQKLKEASLDIQGEEQLMLDCWSTTAKLYAASDTGRGDAAVIAVGGNFFDFHPLRLINGDYLRQSDLMHDRVLLDEDMAWLLFGGTDLQGMTLKLNGVPFVVAGVVQRETDFASERCYTAGQGLFMSYDGLLTLMEDAKINCYEYVMAEPVKNFSITVAREKFPIGRGVILCNTTRFRYSKMIDIIAQFGTRSIQTTGVLFPYWENAARCTEDWGCLCCLFGTLLLVFPVVMAIYALIRLLLYGKEQFEETLWPETKEKAGEAVRSRQRKRWEKQHGGHEQ